jgi:hypothetical protein
VARPARSETRAERKGPRRTEGWELGRVRTAVPDNEVAAVFHGGADQGQTVGRKSPEMDGAAEPLQLDELLDRRDRLTAGVSCYSLEKASAFSGIEPCDDVRHERSPGWRDQRPAPN